MPRTEFEPAILESERPQTHSLGRAATGIGFVTLLTVNAILTKMVSTPGRLFYV